MHWIQFRFQGPINWSEACLRSVDCRVFHNLFFQHITSMSCGQLRGMLKQMVHTSNMQTLPKYLMNDAKKPWDMLQKAIP